MTDNRHSPMTKPASPTAGEGHNGSAAAQNSPHPTRGEAIPTQHSGTNQPADIAGKLLDAIAAERETLLRRLAKQ